MLCQGPALADPRDDSTPGRPAPSRPDTSAAEEEPANFPYEVTITGVEDGDLEALLLATSQAAALADRPPASIARVRLRANEDLPRLRAALRSEGYYDAAVAVELDEAESPLQVTLAVTTGPRYSLAAYELLYPDQDLLPAKDRPDLADLGVTLGMAARGPDIVAAEKAWLRILARRGFPAATVGKRRAVIDRATQEMRITLPVESGSPARFGPAVIKGLERVEADYVLGYVPWAEGETYDSRKLEALRRALVGLGLFASVTVKPDGAVRPNGTLPVAVELSEAAQRSIGFGASYSTDIGFGGEVFWEHRNLFGAGEKLRLGVTGAQIEQTAEASFRKPAFLGQDQALLANITGTNSDSEAFEERSIAGYLGMEFPLLESWRATVGISPEYNDLEDDEGQRQFFLVGLPLAATRDDSDDRLNPTRGTRLGLALTPYYGTGDAELTFLTAVIGGAAYQALDSDDRFVLAGRAKVGALVGERTETLPANKRFYTGGGGSIRGYEFQTVGPFDESDDPAGGRSLVELNLELRVRVSEDIGLVPFVDGGTVFDSTYPDFDEKPRWAAGLGLRYFTGIGPVRADVAFPLNGRARDDTFEFYISFGQAF